MLSHYRSAAAAMYVIRAKQSDCQTYFAPAVSGPEAAVPRGDPAAADAGAARGHTAQGAALALHTPLCGGPALGEHWDGCGLGNLRVLDLAGVKKL